MRRAVEQARSGSSTLLVLERAGGIGKSTIIDAGVRDTHPGILLRKRGRELERDRPFGLVVSMLGRPAADVVRSEAPPRDTASPTAALARRWRTAEALVELAQQRRPSVLLVVDDLQCADEGRALVLHVLALESAVAAASLVARSVHHRGRRTSPRSRTPLTGRAVRGWSCRHSPRRRCWSSPLPPPAGRPAPDFAPPSTAPAIPRSCSSWCVGSTEGEYPLDGLARRLRVGPDFYVTLTMSPRCGAPNTRRIRSSMLARLRREEGRSCAHPASTVRWSSRSRSL